MRILNFKKILAFSFSFLYSALFFFNFAFAEDLGGFITRIVNNLGSPIGTALFALAFVYFFWGVLQYVINPEAGDKREQGRTYMIWGLIGLTVMFAVYGLVDLMIETFFKDGALPTQKPIPKI